MGVEKQKCGKTDREEVFVIRTEVKSAPEGSSPCPEQFCTASGNSSGNETVIPFFLSVAKAPPKVNIVQVATDLRTLPEMEMQGGKGMVQTKFSL